MTDASVLDLSSSDFSNKIFCSGVPRTACLPARGFFFPLFGKKRAQRVRWGCTPRTTFFPHALTLRAEGAGRSARGASAPCGSVTSGTFRAFPSLPPFRRTPAEPGAVSPGCLCTYSDRRALISILFSVESS